MDENGWCQEANEIEWGATEIIPVMFGSEWSRRIECQVEFGDQAGHRYFGLDYLPNGWACAYPDCVEYEEPVD